MLLSVVIPNRNDTVMLGITVRSALEEMKAVPDSELIVVDNSDADIWRLLKTPNISPLSLKYVREGKVKLIRQDFPSMYSARQTGIEEAIGKYIVNTDSHVLYGRNVLKDVVEFMENADKESRRSTIHTYPIVGYGFSPIGWIDKPEILARSDIRPNSNGSVFGTWGRNYDKPAKISWNFGFRIAEREWFLKSGGFGFFADEKVSWGGGEFYVAMKAWLFGRENWAIPASPMYHIGPFNKGISRVSGYRYRLYGASGNGKQGIGILGAFYALAGNYGKEYAKKNKEGLKSQYGLDVDRDWNDARKIARKDREFIKQNQVISFEELVKTEPWMEGWGEDRWSQWQPARNIKQVVNLASL